MPADRKDLAISFLQLVATNRVREAYEAHIDPAMVHHNLGVPGDMRSLMLAMEENSRRFPAKRLEVERVLEQGDVAAVHSRVQLAPDVAPTSVIHIFRFQGDKVVEMWDVGAAVRPDVPGNNGAF